MRIIVDDTGISAASLLRLVWWGYVIGMGVFAVPAWLVAGVSGSSAILATGWTGFLAALVVVPLALALQGLVLGGLILLGLAIYRRFADIRIARSPV